MTLFLLPDLFVHRFDVSDFQFHFFLSLVISHVRQTKLASFVVNFLTHIILSSLSLSVSSCYSMDCIKHTPTGSGFLGRQQVHEVLSQDDEGGRPKKQVGATLATC